MARNISYNTSAASVIIDGVTAVFMGDEFAYSIERPEVGTVTVGTTTAVQNLSSNKTATLNVSLFASSVTNDQLEELYYNQVRSSGKEFDVTILSTEGEIIGCNQCIIGTPPTVEGGGPAQVSRKWALIVKEYVPDKPLFV